MNKPLILTKTDTDRIRLVSSSERLAYFQIRDRASHLERQADSLREKWEAETDDERKIVFRATAVALLGQARGLRLALHLIRRGKGEDSRMGKRFRRN